MTAQWRDLSFHRSIDPFIHASRGPLWNEKVKKMRAINDGKSKESMKAGKKEGRKERRSKNGHPNQVSGVATGQNCV